MGNQRRRISARIATRPALRSIAGALALLAIASCGGGGGDSQPETPRAATISISPQSATLTSIGEQTNFTATAQDQNGRNFPGAVTWSGSDDSIFTVSSSGQVTAVKNGSGTVSASIASLSARADVTVEQAASAIEIVSGSGQDEVSGTELPQPVVIRVEDAGGAPVGGVSVNFQTEAGNGAADPGTAQTGDDGTASTTWTLGENIGEQILTASAGEDARVEIRAKAARLRPQVANGRLPDAHVGISYSAMLRAESGSGSGYTWALASGDLPAGLALATTGEISGVASRADGYEFEVQVTDDAGISENSTFRLRVCEGPLNLELGEFREFHPTTDSTCGFALRASEAGEYYRVTIVGPGKEDRPTDLVALEIASPGGAESSVFEQIYARMFAGAAFATISPSEAVRSDDDPHIAHRVDERRAFSELAAKGELHPLPDLRHITAELPPPAETRDFTFGSPGTLEDNCRLKETRTAKLVAFNDHAAFYAEPDVTPALNEDNVQVVADFYGDYGARVINEYFGGVSDVDGDGRITVFIDSELSAGIAGIVWLGDFLSKDDCEASNAAELLRLERGRFGPAYFSLTGVLVHEAHHLSSDYQWILRNANDPALEVFAKFASQRVWIEEGRSEIAKEMASRLAWEALGGPLPHDRVTRQDLLAYDLGSSDLHGILYVLATTKQALSTHPYALWRHVYGAGWHFLRFLGDWHGNRAGLRLGDSGFFRDLNDAATPGGFQGIEDVTGSSWPELMVEYAIATSLAGTSAPIKEGIPVFKTYDFTGLNIKEHFFETPGRYPWPVTATGETTLWVSLGVSRRLESQLAYNGLLIHDFRAAASGDTAAFRVEAPPHVRAIVVRIPDQSELSED